MDENGLTICLTSAPTKTKNLRTHTMDPPLGGTLFGALSRVTGCVQRPNITSLIRLLQTWTAKATRQLHSFQNGTNLSKDDKSINACQCHIHISHKIQIRKEALDLRFANRHEFRAPLEFSMFTQKSTNCSMAQACGEPHDGDGKLFLFWSKNEAVLPPSSVPALYPVAGQVVSKASSKRAT